MDNKSNYYYPQDIFDAKLNGCSCKNSDKNAPNHKQNSPYSDLNIYPNNYIQSTGEQNYANQQQNQNYAYGQNQNYDYGQAQQNQNFDYGQPNTSNNWQQTEQTYPQNRNQQKNMFGSLNPEQLMSLLSSKGNLSGILGGLGQSNPQLGMLVGLMQNMPKKQAKSDVQSTQNEAKDNKKTFVKVKDYYKENQDE